METIKAAETLKASKALLAHMRKAAAAKTTKNLLEDGEEAVPIWLTVTTKKHVRDDNKLKPSKIALPHSLNADEESTICLIVADPQRAYKDMVQSEAFPEDLRKRITRVIDISHVKSKFKAFEAQRKLASEHEIFLADDRIINRLPAALGKTFYKSQAKRPIPVVFGAQRERVDGKRVLRPKGKKEKRDPETNVNARPVPEIVQEIQKAISAALVHLSPSNNTAVKVAYSTFTPEQVSENVHKVATELVEKFIPKKWDNVRSIYIKGPETAALPIWMTEELWADEAQVIPDAEKQELLEQASEKKANIGKKRKSLDAEPEPEVEAPAPKKKKSKKESKKA